jgi:DNA (cytosine-5)-methyltransferase 1
MRAVDVLGFAGGFTLGTVQAGFELVGKREMKGGFGVANCEANRHLLGYGWKSEACDQADWSPVDAEVVFGNPPCSGFSVMSAKEFRGADSKINHCMWAFADYVIKVKPLIAVFESVQPARTRPDGHALMRRLRDHVEAGTGLKYTLHHVLHNAYSIGGCAQRRRYFWVISQMPFGIEPPKHDRYPTLLDAIGDLRGLQNTWSSQPYIEQPSWWAEDRRSGSDQVDGHASIDNPLTGRIRDLIVGAGWKEREHIALVAKRHYTQHGKLPDSWRDTEAKLVKQDFFMGFTTPVRWPGDEAARVITGGGLVMVVHPTEDRTITHREAARILGFPDDWLIEPLRGVPGLGMTWGKGITVDCGQWIADWIKRALEGDPGYYVGVPIGEREFDIDVTSAWKGSWYSKTSRTTLTKVSSTRGTTMTEPETPEVTETKAGRPRSTQTLERDEKVFEILSTGAKTRVAVGEVLGATPAEAYLSLDRLRTAGRAKSERRDGKFVWFRPDVPEPEPVAAE